MMTDLCCHGLPMNSYCWRCQGVMPPSMVEKCTACGGYPHSHPSGLLCVYGDVTIVSETRNLRLALQAALTPKGPTDD